MVGERKRCTRECNPFFIRAQRPCRIIWRNVRLRCGASYLFQALETHCLTFRTCYKMGLRARGVSRKCKDRLIRPWFKTNAPRFVRRSRSERRPGSKVRQTGPRLTSSTTVRPTCPRPGTSCSCFSASPPAPSSPTTAATSDATSRCRVEGSAGGPPTAVTRRVGAAHLRVGHTLQLGLHTRHLSIPDTSVHKPKPPPPPRGGNGVQRLGLLKTNPKSAIQTPKSDQRESLRACCSRMTFCIALSMGIW